MNVRQYAEQLATVLDSYEGAGIGTTETSATLSALTLFLEDGSIQGVRMRREVNAETGVAEPLADAIERCIGAAIEDAEAAPVLLRYRVQVDSHGGAVIET